MMECSYDMDLVSLMENSQNIQQAFSKMETLWNHFLSEKVISNDELRPSIIKSWERCRDFKINPRCHLPQKLHTGEINKKLSKREEYTEVIQPVISSMKHLTDLSHYVVAFADHQGIILMLYGNQSLKKEVGSINFKVGANWSERYAGTNAIGNAIATSRPSQVFHAEHFCQKLHSYTCTAVPIMDPFTHELIGVLDFASHSENYQPHTLGMAIQMARCIELEIYRKEKEKEAFFREQSLEMTLDHMERGVIVTDIKNHIRRVNLKTLEYLNMDINQLIMQPFHDISLLSAWKNYESPFYLNQSKERTLYFIRKPLIHQDRHIGSLVLLEPVKPKQTVPFNSSHSERFKPVGSCPSFKKVLEVSEYAAAFDSNLLITGETGTGKEVMARFIHHKSNREKHPFIAINCGSIPKDLLGSELFGYHAGAFTGASKKGHQSKFELADKGTLLLDEISEMPLEAQVYLLRVLEESVVTRIGGTRQIPVDVRIIAVSNKDLTRQIKKGLFRADLFYRLNVLCIAMPSLKDRVKDIPDLTAFFLETLSKRMNKPHTGITTGGMELLMSYDWPGNIRELRNVLENAMILSPSPMIHQKILSDSLSKKEPTLQDLSQKERVNYERFMKSYRKHNGNITRVAKTLNITRPTVYSWLKKFNISQRG